METPKQTTMVAKKDQIEMVKIRALRDIRVRGVIIKPGEEVEVTQEEAKDFTHQYTTGFNFSGQRDPKDATRITFKRAELV